MSDDHNSLVREAYSRRASSYNTSSGGWHADLAEDFVKWLDPQHGETVLDLACGTGLVTIPLAAKVGATGKVIGADLTAKMIEVGKERERALHQSGEFDHAAEVQWIVTDITSDEMLSIPIIKEVLNSNGGFDIVSLCSALVLLPDQQAAVMFWVEKLLKPGGRIIIDVPTEDLTMQFLMTYYLPVAIGLPDNLSKGRLWIKSQEGEGSLKSLFESAGLEVEQNLRTRSYVKEIWYPADEATAIDVLQQEINNKHGYIKEKQKLNEALRVWPELWKKATVRKEGGIEAVPEIHPLYVCLGRKAQNVK